MAPTYGLMSRPPVMCPRAAERAKRVKYDLMAVTVVYIEDGQRVAFHGHVLSDATGNPPQGKFGLCVRLGRSRPTWIAGAGARLATVPASVHQRLELELLCAGESRVGFIFIIQKRSIQFWASLGEI